MDDETFVYYASLPKGIKEMVMPCCDGYTIYIDKNLSLEQKMNAYRHAMGHIHHNDFSKIDIQSIEDDAHNQMKQ